VLVQLSYLCCAADVVSVVKMDFTVRLTVQVGDVRACLPVSAVERVSAVLRWSTPVVTFPRCVHEHWCHTVIVIIATYSKRIGQFE